MQKYASCFTSLLMGIIGIALIAWSLQQMSLREFFLVLAGGIVATAAYLLMAWASVNRPRS